MSDIDKSQVDRLFDEFSEEKANSILFNAIKKSAKKLQSDTKAQLKSRLGAGATSARKWGDMTSGIKLRAEKDYCEATVHIMGDFRLKFFEKGTKLRMTRKTKANRGAIRPLYFFRTAQQSDIEGLINQSITEQLNKIQK